jgi:hypothetical protein
LISLPLILSHSLYTFLSFSKSFDLTGVSKYLLLNFMIQKEVNQMTKTMKKNGKKQIKKSEGKKPKDPKRIEAAKKAWETIRAKAKEKQVKGI